MTWHTFPIARFAEFANDWDTLQRRSTNTPFLEAAFLQPLLDEFKIGDEHLALHRGPDCWDAAAIVRPVSRGRWQTFQPSQLPLGPWVTPLGGDLQTVMHDLLVALPGIALSLGVTQLDPRLQPTPIRTPGMQVLDYIKSSFVDVTGSFDEYWEMRGKNLRQNTRKQRNKLQAEGIELQIDCVTSPADVASAMIEYGALESAGWKAESGTAIQPDNAQGRFYTRMLVNFCAMGRGRIYRYRFGEKVVAMDLCIDNGPLVVVLKTAYDESFKQVSPSTLMRQDQFRMWWHEGRYQRIEFYGKTLDWHTRWTSTERTLYHATTYRWLWLARLQQRRAAQKRLPESVDSPTSAEPSAAE